MRKEIKEDIRRQAILAHSIAKQVTENATYEEALETLELAKTHIIRTMRQGMATVGPVIHGRYCTPVEVEDVFKKEP